MTDSKYKEKIVDIKLSETISGEEAPIDFVVSETDSIPQPSPSPENLESKAFDTSETPPDLGPRYDILGLVGTGGMGTVWKVHDKELGEDFAIKVLKPELVTDETALKRFQKEANLASELTHANIAAIFGPGEDGSGRPYIIMRYVDGESLADILKREGKLSEERAMDIFSQLCEALSHSHMKGIVHRDIKPSNIIISKTESGADLVQLVDFGIARCVYDEVTKTQALTKAVDVFGSPRYMSPEQLLGQEVTGQSDIYSLGIVLYEMLTGEPPFTSDNPIELMIQQISQEPNYSKIPAVYEGLLTECLAKNSKERVSNTAVLSEKIQQNKVLPILPRPEWKGFLALVTLLNIIMCSPMLSRDSSSIAILTSMLFIGFLLNLSNRHRAIASKETQLVEYFATCNALLILMSLIAENAIRHFDRQINNPIYGIFWIFLCITGFFLLTRDKPHHLYLDLAYRRIDFNAKQKTRAQLRTLAGPVSWALKYLVGGYLSFHYGLIAAIPLVLVLGTPQLQYDFARGPGGWLAPVPLILSFAVMFLSSCLAAALGKSDKAQISFKSTTKTVAAFALSGLVSGTCVLTSIKSTGIIEYLAARFCPYNYDSAIKFNDYLLSCPNTFLGKWTKLNGGSGYIPYRSIVDSRQEKYLSLQRDKLHEQLLTDVQKHPPQLMAELHLLLAERGTFSKNRTDSRRDVNKNLLAALTYTEMKTTAAQQTIEERLASFYTEQVYGRRPQVAYPQNQFLIDRILRLSQEDPQLQILEKLKALIISELQATKKVPRFYFPDLNLSLEDTNNLIAELKAKQNNVPTKLPPSI